MRSATFFAVAFLLVAGGVVAADDGGVVLGLWATEPGTENGQAHVEIVEEGGVYNGSIVWLEQPVYPPDDDGGMAGQEKVDRENPDATLRTRPILGLQMMEGFEYAGDGEWKSGRIYDPENGKTYKCKMRLIDDETLKVRGFIGVSMLGRTSVWTRVEPEQ